MLDKADKRLQEIETLNLPTLPRIRKIFHIIPMKDEGKLQFRTAGKTLMLSGKVAVEIIPILVPVLNGRNTVSEIISIGQRKGFDKKAIQIVLSKLHSIGILEDAVNESPHLSGDELDHYSNQIHFFSLFNVNGHKCQRAIGDSLITIVGLGGIGTRVLISLVESGVRKIRGAQINLTPANGINSFSQQQDDCGAQKTEIIEERIKQINPEVDFRKYDQDIRGPDDVRPLIRDCDLLIVCRDTPSMSICEWANDACLLEGVRWISGSLEGHIGRIGPAIIPKQTPCYKCYQLRFESALDNYDEFLAYKRYLQESGGHQIKYGSVPALLGLIGHMLALEALKMIAGFLPASSLAKVLIFDFSNMDVSAHNILKLPRCPSCSTATNAPRKKVYEE